MTVQKTWLVTGNLGYIGAEICNQLSQAGVKVIGLDSLQKGLISRVGESEQYIGNISNMNLVTEILVKHKIEGVIHLAANKDIAESLLKPDLFWYENYDLSVLLLNETIKNGVRNFIFASTAAVYKENVPGKFENFKELSETLPNSVYGKTKLSFEDYLGNQSKIHDLNSISLRFFNIAGATESTGWDLYGSNLIPIVFQNLTENQPTSIFGNHFQTQDGSCIRDYLHVEDLAFAVVQSVRNISHFEGGMEILNLGTGRGISVLEVLKSIEHVTGHRVLKKIADPRQGDLVYAVADANKAKSAINWESKRNFEDVIRDAWISYERFNFEKKSNGE